MQILSTLQWPKCGFANAQRQLTHFHCIRPKCTYAFKAKADMSASLNAISTTSTPKPADKHRVMHEREDNDADSCLRHILAQSGACPFAHCTVMRSSHVHCLRDGTFLHSNNDKLSYRLLTRSAFQRRASEHAQDAPPCASHAAQSEPKYFSRINNATERSTSDLTNAASPYGQSGPVARLQYSEG